jgi:hypothetical protein
MVYDLAQPKKGGDDWTRSTITGIRLDLDDTEGGEFTIHQVAIVSLPVMTAVPAASGQAGN